MIYKTVSHTESQVGKYIDINGDGIPEGVIFADLAVGGKGQYGSENSYEIPIIKENLKDYIIVGEYENIINGKQEMLSTTLEGNDRFYVMDLSSISIKDYVGLNFFLYFNATNLNEVLTSIHFGTGKQNTNKLFQVWKDEKYGEQDHRDLWNYIQDKVNDGWFIPSFKEWVVFFAELNISWLNYKERGIQYLCWSSSQNLATSNLNKSNIKMIIPAMRGLQNKSIGINHGLPLRLARTF